MPAFLLSELAARFGGKILGRDASVRGVASLRSAATGDLTFYVGRAGRAALSATAADAVVLAEESAALTALPRWVVDEPLKVFSRVAALLLPPPSDITGVSAAAQIHPQATIAAGVAVAAGAVIGEAHIGENCRIHAGAVVGDGVVIGDDSVLYPRVVLYPGVRLGRRCVLHAGAVVGADGFGYVSAEGVSEKIPHFAGVLLGDDVEVGANSAIDRGMLDDTVIGDGVKIDNLVQIGHNVRIGDNTVICGNVGIAGSVVVGKRCVIAGGAGIVGGVVIGDDARVGGHSVVTRDVPDNTDVLAVWPAVQARTWRRMVANVRRLGRGRVGGKNEER